MHIFFFPNGNDIIDWDPQNPYKTMRRIFEGGVEFNEFEKKILEDFKDDLGKYKKQTNQEVEFPKNWKEYSTLRFIQGSGYKIQVAIENLISHFKWRKENLPVTPSDKIIEILNSGFIYGHGRDHNYRPVFVIRAAVYSKIKENYNVNDWILSLVYFLEYMIANMTIPGQLENWNLILDVDDFSMIFIPSDLKTLFNVLMSNYRCRLYVMFIVNISLVLSMLWKTIKVVLDPNTEKKIKLLKSSEMNEIFKYINPEQVEERFGGKAKTVNEYFFPHIIPSVNFLLENETKNEKLVGKEEYLRILRNNSRYVMSPYISYISDDENEEQSINNEISIYEECQNQSFKHIIAKKSSMTIYELCEENKYFYQKLSEMDLISENKRCCLITIDNGMNKLEYKKLNNNKHITTFEKDVKNESCSCGGINQSCLII